MKCVCLFSKVYLRDPEWDEKVGTQSETKPKRWRFPLFLRKPKNIRIENVIFEYVKRIFS